MEKVLIRTAKPTDTATLAQAEREIAKVPGRLASKPHELKDEAFRSKIEKLHRLSNGLYLVAEENGQIVAHALLDPLGLEAISHVVDLTIAVHEGYQNRGIGKILMRHLIDWSQKNEMVEKIELHVRSSNSRAIALYKRLGFEEQGRKWKRIKIAPNQYLDDISMGLWVGE